LHLQYKGNNFENKKQLKKFNKLSLNRKLINRIKGQYIKTKIDDKQNLKSKVLTKT